MRTVRDGAPEMTNLEPRNDCVYGLSTVIPLPLEHGNLKKQVRPGRAPFELL